MIEVISTPTANEITQASELLMENFGSTLTAKIGIRFVHSLLSQVSISTESQLLIARDNGSFAGYLVVFNDTAAMGGIALRAIQALSVLEKLWLCLVVIAHPYSVIVQARTSQHIQKFSGFSFLSSWAVPVDARAATAGKLLRTALEQISVRRKRGVVVQVAIDKPRLIDLYSKLGFTTKLVAFKFHFLVRHVPNPLH